MSAPIFEPTVTFEQIRGKMQQFADERDWAQFHTPRNLALALTGEVGELAELFMWKHDTGAAPGLPSWTAAERHHLGEELSDVLLYLIRLSDRCSIDLPSAAIAKMAKNEKKYPADAARGSSAKYTAYETVDKSSDARASASNAAAMQSGASSASSATSGASTISRHEGKQASQHGVLGLNRSIVLFAGGAALAVASFAAGALFARRIMR